MNKDSVTNNVLDARASFRPLGELKYVVTIEVTTTSAFLLAVLKCMLLRKSMLIRHTFTKDPFSIEIKK